MKNENCNDFLEIVKQLSQEELGHLINYAIELKKEELENAVINC